MSTLKQSTLWGYGDYSTPKAENVENVNQCYNEHLIRLWIVIIIDSNVENVKQRY